MTGMLLETTAARAIEALPSLALAMLAPTHQDSLVEREAYATTLCALIRETTYADAMHVHNSLCDLLLVPDPLRRSLNSLMIAKRIHEGRAITAAV